MEGVDLALLTIVPPSLPRPDRKHERSWLCCTPNQQAGTPNNRVGQFSVRARLPESTPHCSQCIPAILLTSTYDVPPKYFLGVNPLSPHDLLFRNCHPSNYIQNWWLLGTGGRGERKLLPRGLGFAFGKIKCYKTRGDGCATCRMYQRPMDCTAQNSKCVVCI